ncbi:PPC domain-containing protein [Paenibacillus sp. 481]|uniref:PPC domain-containing protein n=1 Tax=Paenibacillus sp. 481 TaxID=2835869 RepID=UPI001E545B24|nr:PPC domain-containing protein [Paenibacillus sp. 481]UHA75083.1 PPC domain-containing protein [Paenibacillus sp. 481]
MKKVLLSLVGAALITGASAGSVFAHGNSFAKASEIKKVAEEGSVTWTDDDYFYFIPKSSRNYSIRLIGLTADAALRLYDKNEKSIAKSNNPGTANEEIVHYLEANTKYYIKVIGMDKNNKSSYILDINNAN